MTTSLRPMGELLLLRHGETAWSAQGRHTGRTDIPLTAAGEDRASAWSAVLRGRRFVAVLTSPLVRARRTAELAGLVATGIDPDLAEWDYGPAEGRTTAEIRTEQPGWDIWHDGPGPGGEPLAAVGARCDRVLARVHPLLAEGDVAVVAHGHLLRILGARWAGWEPAAGAALGLDAATLCVLAHERERRVIRRWGVSPPTQGVPASPDRPSSAHPG